jgi:hypothetical protein
MEGDPKLMCMWVIDLERPPPGTSALADRNILHPFQVCLKGKGKESLLVCPWLPLSFLISSHLCFRGGADMPMSQMESTRAREVENVAVQASVQEDADGLIRMVTLLEGELVEARQAWEVAEEKFRSLSDASADGTQRLVVFEMECRQQSEELSLLRARVAQSCLAIVGPSKVRSHLLARMWAATLCHTEMARELTALWEAVSSAMELVLGRSPNETSRVEVTNKLVANFWRREELCSRLEGPGVRICDLLLGPPPSQARWGDHMAEADGWLEAELTARRLVDVELGALRISVARV